MNKINIGIIVIGILLLVLWNGYSGKVPPISCSIDGTIGSECRDGLLCNVGNNGTDGVCNTVDQCIESGSTADAVNGSKVCFMGV